MCERHCVTFILLIYMFTLFETSITLKDVTESSSINDDDSMSHVSSKVESTKKTFVDAHLASAIKRGIENILSKSPNHKIGTNREELVNKIEQLLYYHQKSGIAVGRNKSLTIKLTVKNPEDSTSYKRKGDEDDPIDKAGKRKSDIGDKEVITEKITQTPTNENPSKSAKRGIFTKPFDGYMRKLAADVNGVMSEAKYMLRDTGKLIHGLKRVIKGASTLTSVTNNAVKYAKYFASEPSNVTIDYLEEKAIIALLESQKAANESQKAANLAKIASAKALDAQKRIEEEEYQDLKSVMPFVAASGILAEKAEKAARLARIEKQKTEEGFIVMNKELGKMSERMKEEVNKKDTQDVSEEVKSHSREGYFNIKNPDENYFYMKQKQLEKDLSGDKERSSSPALPKPTHSVHRKSPSKIPNLDNEDEGKELDAKTLAQLTTKVAHITKEIYDDKKPLETVAARIARKLIPLLAKSKSIDISSVNDLIGSATKETNDNLEAEGVADTGTAGKQAVDNVGTEKEGVVVNNAFEKDSAKYGGTEQASVDTNSTSSGNEVLTKSSANGKHDDGSDNSLEDSNNESAPVDNIGLVKEDDTAGSSSTEKDNTAANNIASETEQITTSNVKENTVDSERGGTSNSADSDKHSMDTNSTGKEIFGVDIPVSLKGSVTTSSTNSKNEAVTKGSVGTEKEADAVTDISIEEESVTGTEKEAGSTINAGIEKEDVTPTTSGSEKEASTGVGSEKEDSSISNAGSEIEIPTATDSGVVKADAKASNPGSEKEMVISEKANLNANTVNAEQDIPADNNSVSEKVGNNASSANVEKEVVKTNTADVENKEISASSSKGSINTIGVHNVKGVSENVVDESIKPLPSTLLKLEQTKHILSSRKNYVSTHLTESHGKINSVNPIRVSLKRKSVQLPATRSLHGRKKIEKRKNASPVVKLKKQTSPKLTAVKSIKHDMELPTAMKTIKDGMELPSQVKYHASPISATGKGIKHDLELPKRVSSLLFSNVDHDVSNDESSMLLNYLDMDDSDVTESGDSSGDATIDSVEKKELTVDKIRGEEATHKNKKESVSKAKAHKNKLRNDKDIAYAENAIIKNRIPSDLPLDINKIPINIPINVDEIPTFSIESKSKESDLRDKYKGLELATLPDKPTNRKKHDIEKTYEFLDPFGFTKPEIPKKEYNTERNYIPVPEEYYHYKRRERTDIPVPDSRPDYHVIVRER